MTDTAYTPGLKLPEREEKTLQFNSELQLKTKWKLKLKMKEMPPTPREEQSLLLALRVK